MKTQCTLFFSILIVIFITQLLLSPSALPESVFNKPVVVVGKVDNIPTSNPLGSRFLIALKTMDGKKQSGKVEVSWYQHHRIVHPGECWRWTLKLKPIHGLYNPGGFNVERWAKMQSIVASGYIVPSEKTSLLSRPRFSINAFRERLQHAIQHRIHSRTLSSIITALSIGSKDLLSPETWLVFQRTGTSHLMAISGLHVGLVVAIAYFFWNYVLRFFPRLLLRRPAQHIAAVMSVFVAWSYGFLVGMSLPTQRAVIMITVLMLSAFFSRTVSIWQRLLWAFLAVLALQPLALFSASFWLSFMAVFWIAYAAFGKHTGKKQWFRVKLVLTLGLIPVTLYCFHQAPLLSIVANLVAIPWVTLCIVPLCLFASVAFLFSKVAASWLWYVAVKCFFPLWYFLQYISHWNQWLHPINDFFLMIAALMGLLLLAAPRGLPLFALGLALLFPLFFTYPSYPKNNRIWLTVLDVGQGLATVIQTAHHVLIYDAGPRFPTGFDAGRSVLIPFLQTRGIQTINTMVISHGDNDHIGGSFWLVKHVPVNTLMSSIPRSRWHRDFQHCHAGQTWQWDGVRFHMLWPPANSAYADNNSSCVLRVSVGGQAILLTGDIEKPAEQTLVLQRRLLSSTVLVAPHHGSRSSSTRAFVNAVHPSAVIMSVGYRNRYHFPSKTVLERYRRIGAQIFSTAKQGAIRVVLGIPEGIRDNGRLIYRIRSFHESPD